MPCRILITHPTPIPLISPTRRRAGVIAIGLLVGAIGSVAWADDRPLPDLPGKAAIHALRASSTPAPAEVLRLRHRGEWVDARVLLDRVQMEGESESVALPVVAPSLEDLRGLGRAEAAAGRTLRPVVEIHGAEAAVTEWVAYEVVYDLTDGVRFGEDFGLVDIRAMPGPGNTYYVGRAPEGGLHALDIARRMNRSNRWGLRWAEAQITVDRPTRQVPPNDARFPEQWHLNNTGQRGRPGVDINVLPVWNGGYTGSGVVIGVLDDGVQMAHEDFAGNARMDLSYNFVTNVIDPTPSSTSLSHGTSVAGLSSARWNNSLGVVGVAPLSGIAGLRILGGSNLTDSMEASAFAFRNTNPVPLNRIAVKNNSWGPPDDGRRKEGPGPLGRAALRAAAEEGRGGLGTVMVWAGGNGFASGDNTNYDGYANSRYTISVPALLDDGTFASYSEQCSCHHVAAPGGSSNIVTTRYNTTVPYTVTFGGTSTAAPLVSGVVALMLEINPHLTWRDVQHILVDTAVRNDPTQSGWQRNGAGRYYNHNYGFGLVDALAAGVGAYFWPGLPDPVTITTGTLPVGRAIPDFPGPGIGETVTLAAPPNFVAETVEVHFVAQHTFRGDLQLRLISPHGTVSRLADTHSDSNPNYNWTFTSTANWGETVAGDWTLMVTDGASIDVGTWTSWTLTVHGYLESTLGDLWLLTE